MKENEILDKILMYYKSTQSAHPALVYYSIKDADITHLNYLDENGLIKKSYNAYQITTAGLDLFEKCGSQTPIEYFKDSKQRAAREAEQEKMKKWYDHENAKNTFENFPNVEKRANLSIAISIIATAIALITLCLKFSGSK